MGCGLKYYLWCDFTSLSGFTVSQDVSSKTSFSNSVCHLASFPLSDVPKTQPREDCFVFLTHHVWLNTFLLWVFPPVACCHALSLPVHPVFCSSLDRFPCWFLHRPCVVFFIWGFASSASALHHEWVTIFLFKKYQSASALPPLSAFGS